MDPTKAQRLRGFKQEKGKMKVMGKIGWWWLGTEPRKAKKTKRDLAQKIGQKCLFDVFRNMGVHEFDTISKQD